MNRRTTQKSLNPQTSLLASISATSKLFYWLLAETHLSLRVYVIERVEVYGGGSSTLYFDCHGSYCGSFNSLNIFTNTFTEDI